MINDNIVSTLPSDRYNLLIEFAVKHLDFQRAELTSVLDLYGITLGSLDCQILSLPNQGMEKSYVSNGKTRHCTRPFIMLSFTKDLQGSRFHLSEEQKGTKTGIATILARCTLIRSVVELWGLGLSIESCAENVKEYVKNAEMGKGALERVSDPSQSWKTTIHTLGSTHPRKEQDEMRALFAFLEFKGKVQMVDPHNEFILIREVEMDAMGSPLFPKCYSDSDMIKSNGNVRSPLAVYYGRILGDRSVKGRGGVNQYNLKRRAYLGPTSMDAELSFVMANLGQVEPGCHVMDPFVGTGSILLSCALKGAYCIGTDIDLRVLRGKGHDENVRSNFRQFALPRPELVRSDNAIYGRHYRTHSSLYDAIVCDPPYGIRAGARKSGSRLEDPRPIPEKHRHDHIAQTKPYNVSDVMADLLDMAAQTLVMNGRLVYVIPSFSEFDIECDLPLHECLEFLHCCYQPFSVDLGRRMITMKKVREYDESRQEEYKQHIWKNGPESADKCANIREKIIEAARNKPGYEGKAAIRKEKRKLHKEAKKKAKAKFNIGDVENSAISR
jgi:tRNA (guanine10-N2)-methyltransferase